MPAPSPPARLHGQQAAQPISEATLSARLEGVSLRDEQRLRRRIERLPRRGDGDTGAAALKRLAAEVTQAEAALARRRAAELRLEYPSELPISAHHDELLAAIRDNPVVVVAGETGSGKTTQLPKLCLELGRGVRGAIAHTQPRRLAARTIAARIADELGVALGGPVGYAVRFGDRSGEDTLVRLMTDGLLLAEIQHDRLLRRYDTVIVDEAHERSLNIDFLLGYLKRILPRRPDLKLLITSATIDPERFSAHFGGAPVVEVSGRTYPVDVRYRPVVDPDDPQGDPDRDQAEAVGDAVEELMREGPGDVLVFLSGEREIRDTGEALTGRLGAGVEVLPLYARLSASEQQRIFRPPLGGRRRIVLATNVAETSLTVPGIRYVVDAGNARISRYSSRLKVQRLPIESISQASAEQRKGRCGRTADGICIRLYSEQDLAGRPRFTPPEILRTSLAAVILQMAALALGDVEDFPFLDPPDARQVRDGVTLLHELGALERPAPASAVRLTALGRRLARLPVDPRLGRMVLEAGRLGCADEVIVIAAALSIQDPRERPAPERDRANRLHERFADPGSDFLGYLKLWRYLRDLERELSRSGFRRRCRDELLHPLRVREWQDLVGQLRQAARAADVTLAHEAGEAESIHIAVLSGLLSHVGLRDQRRRDYLGARGARFALFPASVLAGRGPRWVMVAELVETTRLWGRIAARIDPSWVEPLAGHLVRRAYDEPRWDRDRGVAVATERVTLYGLPIVAGRPVAYERIDPEYARALFIRHALVRGEWDARHDFLQDNRRLRDEVEALEHRVRRRDILVGEDTLEAFFDERLAAGIASAAQFERWWRQERRRDPAHLTFTREGLMDPSVVEDLRGRPASWRQAGLTLPLSYRFEPGREDDRVTVHVPLRALPMLSAEDFEWLVPAMRGELIEALIRSLPKELRRSLVPASDVAAQALAALQPRRGRLLDALGAELERQRGVRIPREAWDLERLPAHLRMNVRVQDERGGTLGEGRDLHALRERLRGHLRAELVRVTRGIERHGLRTWTIGALPRAIELPGTAGRVCAYPALVDEGETVGVSVFDSPAAQHDAMRRGTCRLLALTVPSPLRALGDSLRRDFQLALAAAPRGSARAVLEDVIAAAIDALVDEPGGPAWDEAGFERLRTGVAERLYERAAALVEPVVRVLEATRDVRARLAGLNAPVLAVARDDVQRQLERLVHRGFVAEAGAARLVDLERYLRATQRRLERLADDPMRDRERLRTLRELEDAYAARLRAWPAASPLPDGLRALPWMLEELRVSLFAQALGTRGPISVRRVVRALDELDVPAAGA